MAKKQRPELSSIISVAARHFQISEDSLLVAGRRDNAHDLGRNAVIFIALKAGYENDEVAEKLGITPPTLTNRFGKLSGMYTRGRAEQEIEFVHHVDGIARDLKFSLLD